MIIVDYPDEEIKKLKNMSKLVMNGDYAEIAWALKIINISVYKNRMKVKNNCYQK